MIQKYLHNPSNIILRLRVHIYSDNTYGTYLMEIIEWVEEMIRGKEVSMVKVRWQHHNREEDLGG